MKAWPKYRNCFLQFFSKLLVLQSQIQFLDFVHWLLIISVEQVLYVHNHSWHIMDGIIGGFWLTFWSFENGFVLYSKCSVLLSFEIVSWEKCHIRARHRKLLFYDHFMNNKLLFNVCSLWKIVLPVSI